MHSSDQEICDLLKKRDEKGLETLYYKYYRLLVVWADSFLNDISHAEDLVQDFFIAIWEKRYLDHISSDSLRSYLYIAVKSRALNSLDKKDPLNEVCNIQQDIPLWEEYDGSLEEVMNKVFRAVKNLPPRSQEIVICVYLHGMKYKEVAEKLQISIATVKTLLVHSLKSLRKSLGTGMDILFFFFFKKK